MSDTPRRDARHRSAANLLARIRIRTAEPVVDAGRYAPKRCVGDTVTVAADVFRDGHEMLRAVVALQGARRRALAASARCTPSTPTTTACAGRGEFTPRDARARGSSTVEAWIDPFATWRDELQRKVGAGQEDLAGELSEGRVLLEQALERAKDDGRRALDPEALDVLDGRAAEPAQFDAALGAGAATRRSSGRRSATARRGSTRRCRSRSTASARASAPGTSSFPRSWGGLKAVEEHVPAIAELGFDVLYMLPIHPIGRTNRKGRNNTLVAGPDDPGSPYAIGGEEGGHDAVHPELGTIDDVRALCADRAAARHGHRAGLRDQRLRRPPVAEGASGVVPPPPRRHAEVRREPAQALPGHLQRQLGVARTGAACGTSWRRIFLHWVDVGVKFFRVDNPHTKPFAFWEWLIAEVHAVDRDVVFLAEAFTRRAVMRELAKLGFTQSYTYFTWKNSRWELTEYVNELAWGRGARVLPAELLPGHAGHPARLPRSTAARRRSSPGSCSPPRWPELRHLLGLRALRERAGARGLARST